MQFVDPRPPGLSHRLEGRTFQVGHAIIFSPVLGFALAILLVLIISSLLVRSTPT
ncbi:MAG: hypothetical protein ACYDD1_15905 [Caulobacteraceae bacterium]